MIEAYAVETGVTAVSLDTGVSLRWADKVLPAGMPVQGNLDPSALFAEPDALAREIGRSVAGAREPGAVRPRLKWETEVVAATESLNGQAVR